MNQLAFKDQPEAEEPKRAPELVTTPPASGPREPEQLNLRMLQLVESIHAGQQSITAVLKDIKQNLPEQRRPLSKRTQQIHLRVIWARRNGLCPCCQETQVCDENGRVGESEYDHAFSRSQNRVSQTWLVCKDCNANLRNTDFRSEHRAAFDAYQMALKPFMSRQGSLALTAGAPQ
jgi:hypothetical protein